MTTRTDIGPATIYTGDVMDGLAEIPSASIQCVITSPPYWGLRDYGIEGMIGLEPTLQDWLDKMVAVCREIRRVLREDGTFWLNVGDAYNGSPPRVAYGDQADNSVIETDRAHLRPPTAGLKPKDLLMMPARLALALQADGWWVRSDIIWAKPNPMPESVTDRPTSAHEHIFLLTRSGESQYWTHRERPGVRSRPEPDYRWVHKETREEIADEIPPDLHNWRRKNLWRGHDYYYDADAVREEATEPRRCGAGSRANVDRDPAHGTRKQDAIGKRTYEGFNDRYDFENPPSGRNLRDVWTMATQPYPEAHFATFPEELPRKCIMAGTSERGCCPECGAPWERITETERSFESGSGKAGNIPQGKGEVLVPGNTSQFREDHDVRMGPIVKTRTLGWQPTCGCKHHPAPGPMVPYDPIPCTVLDPFCGSGTTLKAALDLGRRCIGIELNPEDIPRIRRRIEKVALQERLPF